MATPKALMFSNVSTSGETKQDTEFTALLKVIESSKNFVDVGSKSSENIDADLIKSQKESLLYRTQAFAGARYEFCRLIKSDLMTEEGKSVFMIEKFSIIIVDQHNEPIKTYIYNRSNPIIGKATSDYTLDIKDGEIQIVNSVSESALTHRKLQSKFS